MLSKPGDSIHALVIEAMYPTIEEATGNRLAMYFGAPGRMLSPLLLAQLPLRTGVKASELRPIDAMAQLAAPVLVIGGSEDLHTTAQQTQRVFAAAPQPKQLWIVQGAAHVDFHRHARAEYERRVGRFFERHLMQQRAKN